MGLSDEFLYFPRFLLFCDPILDPARRAPRAETSRHVTSVCALTRRPQTNRRASERKLNVSVSNKSESQSFDGQNEPLCSRSRRSACSLTVWEYSFNMWLHAEPAALQL